ncbi:hypothetical protein HDV01_005105 [Terramyces sp. JEL0728]|nr:hypothetical protein HDV01_005105 [Terramyces sp. JEL0728]
MLKVFEMCLENLIIFGISMLDVKVLEWFNKLNTNISADYVKYFRIGLLVSYMLLNGGTWALFGNASQGNAAEYTRAFYLLIILVYDNLQTIYLVNLISRTSKSSKRKIEFDENYRRVAFWTERRLSIHGRELQSRRASLSSGQNRVSGDLPENRLSGDVSVASVDLPDSEISQKKKGSREMLESSSKTSPSETKKPPDLPNDSKSDTKPRKNSNHAASKKRSGELQEDSASRPSGDLPEDLNEDILDDSQLKKRSGELPYPKSALKSTNRRLSMGSRRKLSYDIQLEKKSGELPEADLSNKVLQAVENVSIQNVSPKSTVKTSGKKINDQRLNPDTILVEEKEVIFSVSFTNWMQPIVLLAAAVYGQAIDIPPLVTDIPPLVTDIPPLVTDIPPLVTDQPPLNTELPPLNTEMPPLVTEIPPLVTDQPLLFTELPPLITEIPPLVTDLPQLPPQIPQLPPLPLLITDEPQLITDLPPLQTYIPPLQTYIPPLQTYIPPLQTYIPPLQTYIPPIVTQYAE